MWGGGGGGIFCCCLRFCALTRKGQVRAPSAVRMYSKPQSHATYWTPAWAAGSFGHGDPRDVFKHSKSQRTISVLQLSAVPQQRQKSSTCSHHQHSQHLPTHAKNTKRLPPPPPPPPPPFRPPLLAPKLSKGACSVCPWRLPSLVPVCRGRKGPSRRP